MLGVLGQGFKWKVKNIFSTSVQMNMEPPRRRDARKDLMEEYEICYALRLTHDLSCKLSTTTPMRH
jgi:hypothetical protein